MNFTDPKNCNMFQNLNQHDYNLAIFGLFALIIWYFLKNDAFVKNDIATFKDDNAKTMTKILDYLHILGNKIDTTNIRLDKIDARLDRMDTRMDRLEVAIHSIDIRLHSKTNHIIS